MIIPNRTLSLDLASVQSGWVVIQERPTPTLIDHGLIKPPRKCNADERLPYIEGVLSEVLDKYKVTHVILETPAGGQDDKAGPTQNWKTMSILFLTHGVVRNVLQKRRIKYEIVSPSTWQNRLEIFKRDRAGRKAGAKAYAVKQWNLPEDLEQDIYDAICLYDCAAYLKEWDGKEEEEASAF